MESQTQYYKTKDHFVMAILEMGDLWPNKTAVEGNHYFQYYELSKVEKTLSAYQASGLRQLALILSKVQKRARAAKKQPLA